MDLDLAQDIRSITDLKRDTKAVLARVHKTGRPLILTLNGRADAVLMDACAYEQHLRASNLAKLLAPAEADARAGKTRPLRSVLKQKAYRNAA